MLLVPLLLVAALILFCGQAPAGEPGPSYVRDVKPFLARYCTECHNAYRVKGGLNLETYKDLMQGGKTGPVVVVGQPDDSRLVLLPEAKEKPPMPPPKAPQPKPQEVAVLRAWVAAGASDDSSTAAAALPAISPRVRLAPPVSALAYRPDGKWLAAGSHQEVVLIETAHGEIIGRISGQTGKVTALAFSRDGTRLAVASGLAGKAGEIRMYRLPPDGLPRAQPEHVIAAHGDVIYDLAFSPDGRLLASCGYDRLIQLWETATGKGLHSLKDHSDAVYSVAFSPDGKLLASGAADRAVKVWDVATGKRILTLGEATDWVYAVAWSHQGRHLAAGGVDKSIRVWEVSPEGGKLVHAVFAHEAPITRLVYSADDGSLYSLSEDRTAKAWDTSRMVERRVYPRQPALPLALALRPDQKQLALGRFDGGLALFDEVTGKVQAQPLPEKPKPPVLAKLTPNSGRRGETIRIRFEGKQLTGASEVIATSPSLSAKIVASSPSAEWVEADVTFPARTPAGVYQLGLKTAAGKTATLPFTLDLYPAVTEQEPNDSAATGQKLTLPASVVGALEQAGDVDFYRFEASAGQQIGVQVLTTPLGSKLEPVLQLTDSTGRVLAESVSGLLGYTCVTAGTYALGLHDRDYRGGSNMHYRLHVGDIPIVTSVFPLGLQRGTEAEIRVEGVNLGSAGPVHVQAPADAALGTFVPITLTTPDGDPLGIPRVEVGEFPEITQAGDDALLPVPGTGNGVIATPGGAECWRFAAKKGQRLVVEVNARRLGSPLDSTIEILDAHGQPVPRATLRCLAQTYATFRDHDSTSPGIRLENWSELAMNDYLYVGGELIRIAELPRNPDDDCRFVSVAGKRFTFLDTTPTYHALGTPMYKVAIRPPDTTFPPNGLPVFTLYYRNDDGGPGYGKDSRLRFDAPTDGEYQVRVREARGQGGPSYTYRLTVRPPRPDFQVRFNPASPAVWKGGALPISVTADRIDGFDGAIEVRFANLPPGIHAPLTTIPAGEYSTSFALFAEAGATVPTNMKPLQLVARETIGGLGPGREKVVAGGSLKLIDPGDLVATTDRSEVTVRPGHEVRLTVQVERRNGFKGRVPIEVRGLPHGVRVLDIGLNGILITEAESSRTFVIYAEPWVEATEHPFVVLAKREGKNTEHAAKSVLLKVVK
jgi:WD40 repeat protein